MFSSFEYFVPPCRFAAAAIVPANVLARPPPPFDDDVVLFGVLAPLPVRLTVDKVWAPPTICVVGAIRIQKRADINIHSLFDQSSVLDEFYTLSIKESSNGCRAVMSRSRDRFKLIRSFIDLTSSRVASMKHRRLVNSFLSILNLVGFFSTIGVMELRKTLMLADQNKN